MKPTHYTSTQAFNAAIKAGYGDPRDWASDLGLYWCNNCLRWATEIGGYDTHGDAWCLECTEANQDKVQP